MSSKVANTMTWMTQNEFDWLSIRYFPSPNSNEKEVLLDENDELWVELRHQHIAVVSTLVTQNLKRFTESKRMGQSDKQSMRDLSQMIKKMPQYQKELSKYSTHLHLAEDCMKAYQVTMCQWLHFEIFQMKTCVFSICGTGLRGQFVSRGTRFGHGHRRRRREDQRSHAKHSAGYFGHGKRIDIRHSSLYLSIAKLALFLVQNVSPYDKIRIIALYAMVKNGISDDNLVKLFTHAQIGPKEQDMVRNLVYLGVNCVTEVIWKCPALPLRFAIDLLWLAHINRVIETRTTPFHVKIGWMNKPISCHVGHQSSRISWKIASTTNWMRDTSHFWPVALKMFRTVRPECKCPSTPVQHKWNSLDWSIISSPSTDPATANGTKTRPKRQ